MTTESIIIELSNRVFEITLREKPGGRKRLTTRLLSGPKLTGKEVRKIIAEIEAVLRETGGALKNVRLG